MEKGILIFSRDKSHDSRISKTLKGKGFEILFYEEIDEYEAIFKIVSPIVVFLSFYEYEYEEKRNLIEFFKSKDIPLIIIIDKDDISEMIEMLSYGAHDYLTNPISEVELVIRINSCVNYLYKKNEIEKYKIKYEEAVNIIEKYSEIDGVTGIANRNSFEKQICREWNRGIREKYEVGLIFLDIEQFLEYNKVYGFQEGDKCIGLVAKLISASLRRPSDFLFRYEKDTFAVILSNTTKEGVLNRINEIFSKVKSQGIEHKGHPNGIITLRESHLSKIPQTEAQVVKFIEEGVQSLNIKKNA